MNYLATRTRELALAGLIALPGLLTLYLSFDSGGFFAGAPGLVATLLGLLLVLRATLSEDPFAGLTRHLVAILVALGLLAFWILISFLWSDAPARSIIEFDRALMYWLALLLFASVPWRRSQVEWAVRALAGAILVVAAAALVSRLLPDVLETTRAVDNKRLSYPLSYWNALGLLCALGSVLLAHLCASEREPPAIRVAAAGAMPVIVGALFFTFSRGAMAVAIVGVVVYLAVARPRGLPGALLSAGMATVATLVFAYRADLLAGDHPASAAAASQGHGVAVAVVLSVAMAAVLRLALLGLDRRMERLRVSTPSARHLAAGGLIVAALAVFALALGGADRIVDQYDDFVSTPPSESGDLRARLSSAGSNGRSDQWNVALDGFRDAPLTGQGAASYPHQWAMGRSSELKVEDAHSLYVETLAELGLVGLALLGVTLVGLLAGFAGRSRRRVSHVHAVLVACGIAWALHAGIDWDWEMPAVTLWLFALGGMGLAGEGAAVRRPAVGQLWRVTIGLGLLGLVVLPALMAVSQARLNDSVAAFKRGDCGRAIDSALASVDAVSVRPEPFTVIGYCDARLGRTDLGVRALEAAVERDGDNWQLHYGLALLQAAAGRDPRPEARIALRLNPREPLAKEAVRLFRTSSPEEWRRRAHRAQLPIL